MYYFIEKSTHAPSGIALIISFTKYIKRHDSQTGWSFNYPEDEKVLHDESAHLGGEWYDIIANGISESKILTAKELIEKIFV